MMNPWEVFAFDLLTTSSLTGLCPNLIWGFQSPFIKNLLKREMSIEIGSNTH